MGSNTQPLERVASARVQTALTGRITRAFVALCSVVAAIGVALFSGLSGIGNLTVAGASDLPSELSCTTIYGLEENGHVYSISISGSTATMTTSGVVLGGSTTMNGLGIAAGGAGAYATAMTPSHTKSTVYYKTTTATGHATVPALAGGSIIGGGVDPANGDYYYQEPITGSGKNYEAIFLFTTAQEKSVGEIATIPMQAATMDAGDIAFDAQGDLFMMEGQSNGKGDSPGYVVEVLASQLPKTAATPVPSVTAKLVTSTEASGGAFYNGLATTTDGELLGNYSTATSGGIVAVNPNNGALGTAATYTHSSSQLVDLGNCAYTGSLKVEKNVAQRVGATDQFKLSITGGDLASAITGTTSGTATGLQTATASEIAGPVIGLPGLTYTVSESAAGTANLANYVSSYVCTNAANSNATVAKGTGTAATFKFPATLAGATTGAEVTCVFTNSPKLTVTKAASPTTYSSAGQVITYTFVVTNHSVTKLSHVKVTDTQATAGEILTSGPTCTSLTSPTGTCSGSTVTLAGGQSAKFTATYTVTATDVTNKSVSDSAVATGTTPSSVKVTSPLASAKATWTQPVAPGFTTTIKLPTAHTIGNSWNDSATLTGRSGDGVPGGSVTFTFCTESSGPCTGGTTVATLASATSTNSTALTATYTLPAADAKTPAIGSYCYNASYSGGGYYAAVSKQTDSECFTVTPDTSTTTTQQSASTTGQGSVVIGPSDTVTDRATVTGVPAGGTPTGTVQFSLCGPSASSTPVLCTPTTTDKLGAAQTLSAGSGTPPTAGVTSPSYLPGAPGTYCFASVYTPAVGSKYASSSDNVSGAAQSGECFTVAKAASTTTTQQSASTTGEGKIVIGAGGSVSDTVTVAGVTNGGAPKGTVQFYVCGPSTSTKSTCAAATAHKLGAATTIAAATSTPPSSKATSASFTPSSPGTYCFSAVYTATASGNYAGSSDNVTGSAQPDECFAATESNFTVVKSDTAGSGNVKPDQTLKYTVATTNVGTATGSAVVTDTLPANLAYVAGTAACPTLAAPGTCTVTVTGSTLTIDVTLAAGTSATVTFQATVSPTDTTSVTNTAKITSGICTVTQTCSSSVTNPVAVFAFAKTDTAGTGAVTPGQTLTYTITSSNIGTGTGSTTVTDTLPANLAYVAGTAACPTLAAPGTCSVTVTGSTLTVDVTLAAGASATVTFQATVSPTDTTTVTNTAKGTGPCITTAACDPSTSNPVVAFTVLKSDTAGTGAVSPGQTLTYTITTTNIGTGTGSTTVTDTLPANLAYVASSAACPTLAAPGTCTVTVTGSTITIDLTLAAKASATVTFQATVSPTDTTSVVNTATGAGPCVSSTACTSTVTNPVASFTVLKTDTAGTGAVSPGQALTYTITTTNVGTTTGSTTVTDTLPANLTYKSSSAKCPTLAAPGTCTVTVTGSTLTIDVTLAAGASATVTFQATVTATDATTVVNTATSTGPCASATTCSSTVANPVATFVVTKTDTAGPGAAVTPGETLTYTIGTTNVGTTTGSTTVTDTLPANLAYVASSAACPTLAAPGTCTVTVTGSTITIDLTLAAGASATVTFQATVSPTDTTSVTNTATATGPCVTTAACHPSITNPVASFTVTKTDTAGTGAVTPGQALTYTITTTNVGTTTGSTTVTDTLPANLAYVASSAACPTLAAPGTCTVTVTGSTITIDVTLAAGASAAVTFQADVSATDTTTVVNTATGTGPCASATACTSTVTNPAVVFAFAKTDTAGAGATVSPGQTLSYTITAANIGTATGSTTVTDTLPANLAYVAGTAACPTLAAPGTCTVTVTGSTLTIDVTLAAGTSATVTFQATVSPTDTTTVTNTAKGTGPCITSTACDPSVTNPVAVFAFAKTDTAGTGAVTPGQTLTYTITSSNIGTGTGSTTVTDTLPANLAYVASSAACPTLAAPGTCTVTVTGSTITIDLTLAAGASATVTFQATVTATDATTVVNTATSTGPCASATTCSSTVANPVATFVVTKTDTAGPGAAVTPGETLTYTITAANIGTATGSTTVTDTLPANLAYVAGTAACPTLAAPGTCTVTVTGSTLTIDVTLAAGTSATVTFQATVSPTDTTTVTNTAKGTGPCITSTACDPSVTNPVAVFAFAKTDTAGTGAVTPGQTLTYTITSSNIGTGTGSTTVTDTLPANLAYVAGTAACPTLAAPGTCTVTVTGSTLTIDVTLAAGTSATVTFQATVSPTDTTTVTNNAKGTGPCITSTACDPSVTNPVVALSVVKSSLPVSGSTVAPGAAVTYSLTLTNAGSAIASGVAVADTAPTGTSYVSGSGSCGGAPGCAVTESGGVISWTGLSVGPGPANAITVTFQVEVDSTDTGGETITNVAAFTNEGTPNCTTATCETNMVTVTVRSTSPTSGTTTTTAPPRQTSPITGATSVHTGEPFAGSGKYELVLLAFGLAMIIVGCMVGRRRRRRHA